MERGSAKHSARADDELARELDAQLHRGGAQPEPWKEPEPLEDAPEDTSADRAERGAGTDVPGKLRQDPRLGPADAVRDI